jgi:hypothetical protein
MWSDFLGMSGSFRMDHAGAYRQQWQARAASRGGYVQSGADTRNRGLFFSDPLNALLEARAGVEPTYTDLQSGA